MFAGRLGRAIAVVALVAAGAVVVPSAASAGVISPPPPPVDEVLDIPSRTLKSLTGSPLGDGTLIEMWRALKGNPVGPQAPVVVPPAAPPVVPAAPKPITPPKPLMRLGVDPITAATIGFGIGYGGVLVTYGVLTGQSWDETYCNTPGWYQGTADYIMMGLTPDCVAPIINGGLGGNTELSLTIYSGVATYVGEAGSGGNKSFCYSLPALATGHNWAFISSETGSWSLVNPGHGGVCFDTYGPDMRRLPNPGWTQWANRPALVVVDQLSGGTIVGEMTSQATDTIRRMRCTITWEDGSTTSGTGATWAESMGAPVSVGGSGLGCEQAYVSQPGRGPALMPSRIQVDGEEDGGAITSIADHHVPAFSAPERQAMFTTATGGLSLVKVVNDQQLSCMTWVADCVDWWPATSQGTQEQTSTGLYRCLYAGALVDLAECGVYRYTFDQKTSTPTITDPVTGVQHQWSSTPSTQNSLSPGVGPGIDPADECFAQWSAAPNPIEWVLHPIKCALVWAFVPREQVVQEQLEGLEEKWKNTGPAKLALAVMAWNFVPPAAGCDGVTVPIGDIYGHGVQNFQILRACAGEPLAPIAVLSSVVIGISSVLGLVWSLTRSFGGVVGFTGLGGGRGGD